MVNDPFVGIWILDPAHNQYQFGTPPQQGTYTIQATSNSYHIIMEWTGADGQPMQAAYDSIPDGQDHPFEGSVAVDALCTTRVDEYTLDTVSKKDGKILASGRRVLSKNQQQMTVTQSGLTPDGAEFRNISVYFRSMDSIKPHPPSTSFAD